MFRGALRCSQLGVEFFLEAFCAESLTTFPTTWITDNLVSLIVDCHGGGIRFHGEFVPHIARRHTVTVAIERQPEILMYQSVGAVAVIRSQDW